MVSLDLWSVVNMHHTNSSAYRTVDRDTVSVREAACVGDFFDVFWQRAAATCRSLKPCGTHDLMRRKRIIDKTLRRHNVFSVDFFERVLRLALQLLYILINPTQQTWQPLVGHNRSTRATHQGTDSMTTLFIELTRDKAGCIVSVKPVFIPAVAVLCRP